MDMAPATSPRWRVVIMLAWRMGRSHAGDQAGRGNNAVIGTQNSGAQPSSMFSAMTFRVSAMVEFCHWKIKPM